MFIKNTRPKIEVDPSDTSNMSPYLHWTRDLSGDLLCFSPAQCAALWLVSGATVMRSVSAAIP